MQNSLLKVTRQGHMQIKTYLDTETRVTSCEVALLDEFNEKLIIGRGKAKWNPIDFFDPEIGEGIALGRALAKYGKNLAAFWDRQSGSVGERKAQLKIAQEKAEIGEVFYYSLHRKDKVEKPISPERQAWIDEQKAKANVNRIDAQIKEATDMINNAPPKPTTALGASDIILDNLVQENRAKLGGQHI